MWSAFHDHLLVQCKLYGEPLSSLIPHCPPANSYPSPHSLDDISIALSYPFTIRTIFRWFYWPPKIGKKIVTRGSHFIPLSLMRRCYFYRLRWCFHRRRLNHLYSILFNSIAKGQAEGINATLRRMCVCGGGDDAIDEPKITSMKMLPALHVIRLQRHQMRMNSTFCRVLFLNLLQITSLERRHNRMWGWIRCHLWQQK